MDWPAMTRVRNITTLPSPVDAVQAMFGMIWGALQEQALTSTHCRSSLNEFKIVRHVAAVDKIRVPAPHRSPPANARGRWRCSTSMLNGKLRLVHATLELRRLYSGACSSQTLARGSQLQLHYVPAKNIYTNTSWG